MVSWDWEPTFGLNEEIQVSSINVTTRSKGLVMDQGLVFPKAKRIKETMKKIIDTTQKKHKVSPENIKETILVINKHVKTMANKLGSTKKGT